MGGEIVTDVAQFLSQTVGGVPGKRIRATETVDRWGKDEFCVFQPVIDSRSGE